MKTLLKRLEPWLIKAIRFVWNKGMRIAGFTVGMILFTPALPYMIYKEFQKDRKPKVLADLTLEELSQN